MHFEAQSGWVVCCPKHAAEEARSDRPEKPALRAETAAEVFEASIKTICESYGHPQERRRRWVVAAESQEEDAQGRSPGSLQRRFDLAEINTAPVNT